MSIKNSNKSFRLIEFNVYDSEIALENSEEGNAMWDNKEFIVQMFGINETGETVSIIVDGFKPFFYVLVDDTWNDATKSLFINNIKEKIGPYYEDSIISSRLIQKKKLYGFDAGKTHTFVSLEFKNMRSLNCVKKLWFIDTNIKGEFNRKLIEDGYIFETTKTRIYESQIPPLLKLFHIKEISPSGWIELPDEYCLQSKTKTTSCKYEYRINYDKIISLPDKETQVPYKICSFDIEASSSHGDFPLPIKNYKRLAMNIVDTWLKHTIDWTNALYLNDKYTEILKKMIYIAFKIESEIKSQAFNDIDEVYPKITVTKAKIDSIFNNWIKIKPATENFSEDYRIKEIEDLEENHELLMEDQDVDDEKELANDNDNDNDNDEDKTIFYYRKEKIKKYTNKEGTIIDLLNDVKCSRDTKIQELTKTLSKSFPDLKGDTVTFIGSTFQLYGEAKPYMNHCIVLNGCSQPKNVDNCVIASYRYEEEVLLAWTRLIQKEDPDIIVGYNINGFDFDFMDKRSQELDCRQEFLMLSRNKKEICWQYDWKKRKHDLEQSKIVVASGEHNLRFINMTGRLQIDLYNYFRRDYQLSSYKLDYVSGYFIGDTVISIQLSDISHVNSYTTIYSKNLKGLDVGSFINFEETSHSMNQYKKGQKFEIRSINIEDNLFTIHGHENLDMTKKVRWGLAKDDISPQEIFKMGNGSDDDRAIIAKYCIKDCKNCLDLLLKVDVLTNYIEMAKLCSVPINYLVIRGQGIKLTSYIAKKCSEKDMLMPVIEKKEDDGGYEGAIVLEPKCNLYLKDPIACVDYGSLYPSSMISENLSHDSKVWTREYDLENNIIYETGEKDNEGNYIYDNMSEYKYVDITYDLFKWERRTPSAAATKVKVGYKKCRFAQFPQGKKGILPSILEELLASRKATRRQIVSERDEFMKNVLDKRQLAIKVTANSLYGQCGARTSTFYEKDVAASTTATGRKLLLYAKNVIETAYADRVCVLRDGQKVKTNAEVVYGDTDSVFFKFNLRDLDDNKIEGRLALAITIELAQEAGNLATKFLKLPHDLEYEKTFLPFALLSKKRYVGILHEFDPTKGKLKSMGLVLKRRDNADIVKDIYGGIIDILMGGSNVEHAITHVRSCLSNIIDEKYPREKLIITKALRSTYKNPLQIAHKVLANRMGERDPGNKPKSGDRIPYIFIENQDKKALQGEKIETPAFIDANNIKINYTHYITNQIMKPIQQIFALVLEDIREFKTGKEYTNRTWKNELAKLREKWPEEEKFKKKEQELRCKAIKKILFDEYIK